MFPDWDDILIAVSLSFHSVAILCTFFRLWYQWYTDRMWWDDAWATLALLADIFCLVVTALEQPVPDDSIPRFFVAGNWIFSLAYPTLMWAARISILASIVRVLRPEGILRRISLGVGALFGLVGVALLAMRLSLCIANACLMMRWVLIFQISSDGIADALLTTLPLWFLRGVKLSRKRRILICSAFSATMVINVVTIAEAVVLLKSDLTSGSIIFEHVKVACTMIVCNLLVMVTFAYRSLRRDSIDIEDAITSKVELTTIDLSQVELDQETSGGWPSAKTKSSSWSFHGTQSKVSRCTTVTMSRIDTESVEGCG